MQTGIYYWFGFPIPNRERLKLIASAGFENVFIWWADQYADIDGLKEMLPELARNAGLYVENIHTDFESANLLWLDKPGWEDLMGGYMASIDACFRHQIPTMVVHLTKGDAPPPVNALGLDRLRRLVARAEEKNVNIALENLQKPEYLDYVFGSVCSDKLKFCYDSGHENCYSKTGDLLDKFGDKLISLHLHDNDGTDDQHRIPGEGNIDWKTIADKLKKKNYSGSISLEVTNEFSEKTKGLSAEHFLEKAYYQANSIANLCDH